MVDRNGRPSEGIREDKKEKEKNENIAWPVRGGVMNSGKK